jgi:hypothetical protein
MGLAQHHGLLEPLFGLLFDHWLYSNGTRVVSPFGELYRARELVCGSGIALWIRSHRHVGAALCAEQDSVSTIHTECKAYCTALDHNIRPYSHLQSLYHLFVSQ